MPIHLELEKFKVLAFQTSPPLLFTATLLKRPHRHVSIADV